MKQPPVSQFDFKNIHRFARRYLDTYYTTVNEDEVFITRFLLEKFQQFAFQQLPVLEIGCGPTVHHALTIAPYVGEIDMADYLIENLEEIRMWKEGHPEAFPWTSYVEMNLKEQGKNKSNEEVTNYEIILRKKIRNLYCCDVKQSPPLSKRTEYPVVMTFYCAEEVGTTTEEWKKIMMNISMMVAKDGYLFLSALRGTNQYILGDPDGLHEWLPCAPVTEKLMQNFLRELGYISSSIDIRSIDTPNLSNLGIPGILIASAQKT